MYIIHNKMVFITDIKIFNLDFEDFTEIYKSYLKDYFFDEEIITNSFRFYIHQSEVSKRIFGLPYGLSMDIVITHTVNDIRGSFDTLYFCISSLYKEDNIYGMRRSYLYNIHDPFNPDIYMFNTEDYNCGIDINGKKFIMQEKIKIIHDKDNKNYYVDDYC